jgi:hypothetical protein
MLTGNLLAREVGASDCETLSAGLLVQPYNAWSSAAFIVVGGLVALRGWRSPASERIEQVLYGAIVAAVGIGSVLFHGPQPPGSRFLHDLPIAAILLFIVMFDLAAILGWSKHRLLPVFFGAMTALGVTFAVVPDAAIPVTVPLVATAAITEVLVYRRHLRGSEISPRALRLYAVIAIVVGTGALLNALGRTDGPLCDPDGALQLHGLWHLLTAVALGLWAYIGFPTRQWDPASQATTS